MEDNDPDELIYRPAPKKYEKMFLDIFDLSGMISGKTQKGTLKQREKKLLQSHAHVRIESYLTKAD